MDNETRQLAKELTDDRQNPDLLVFEKTWGHRLLAGVSVGMLVVAFVFIAYCVYGLAVLSSLGLSNMRQTYGYSLYMFGIVSGAMLVPPAVLGIFVAKHPKWALAAVVAPVIAILILLGVAVYAALLPHVSLFALGLYLSVAAIFPLVYLVAALKVKSSL